MVVCGTAPSATDLAKQLRLAGRLDHTVELKSPSSSDRQSLLEGILQSKKASCKPDDIEVGKTIPYKISVHVDVGSRSDGRA